MPVDPQLKAESAEHGERLNRIEKLLRDGHQHVPSTTQQTTGPSVQQPVKATTKRDSSKGNKNGRSQNRGTDKNSESRPVKQAKPTLRQEDWCTSVTCRYSDVRKTHSIDNCRAAKWAERDGYRMDKE